MGQASVPAPLPWDGPLLRAQAVKHHPPGPWGSEPNGGVCPRALPVAICLPTSRGAGTSPTGTFSLPNREDARLTGPSGPSP